MNKKTKTKRKCKKEDLDFSVNGQVGRETKHVANDGESGGNFRRNSVLLWGSVCVGGGRMRKERTKNNF